MAPQTRPALNPLPLTNSPPPRPANAAPTDWGTDPVAPNTYEPIVAKRFAPDSTLVVVDLRHLCYRAFYTIEPRPIDFAQKSMTLRIVLDSLDAVLAAANTRHLLVVNDGSIDYKRQAHPAYKDRQDRKDDPDRARESAILAVHLDVVTDFLLKNRVPMLHLPDIEADDAAGLVCGLLHESIADTLTALADRQATLVKRVLLVTDDKDYYQLVRPPTNVSPEVLIWRGVLKRIIDTAEFTAKHGFPPECYPDYKALVGESKTGDNIPGVPGIGDVYAGRMIAASRTLEGVIAYCRTACASGKPKKIEQSVFTHAAAARLSLRLSTITRTAAALEAWGFPAAKARAMVHAARDAFLAAMRPTKGTPVFSTLTADGVNPDRAAATLRRIGVV